MKHRVLIILLSVTLGCVLVCAALYLWWGYSAQLREQRAQALAHQVADALGHTPASRIVEFKSCGIVNCLYNVYFTSPRDTAGLDARLRALGPLHLRVGLAFPGGGILPLLDVNGGLGQERLTAASAGPYREPGFAWWTLLNERGETVAYIYLYHTQGTGVTYRFDGKPFPDANIVDLHTLVSPIKD
jgi:hypothetical protein